MQMQAKKLNLDSFNWNRSDKAEVKLFVASGNENSRVNLPPKGEMITTINLLRDKMKDTMAGSQKMVISLNQTAVSVHGDSAKGTNRIHPPVEGHNIFNVLYGVDSLQEPLRVGEIDSAYKTALQQKDIRIPFSIIKTDSCSPDKELQPNEVTVGFVNPVIYKMQPGNPFPNLPKQINPAHPFFIIAAGHYHLFICHALQEYAEAAAAGRSQK